MTQSSRPTTFLGRLWRADAPLTGTGVAMLAVLVLALLGLWLDPRTITGMPAWLKPAKFALSIAIYTLTLAWVFQWLQAWPRLRSIVGRGSAAIFVLEIAVICVQAWRGEASHFNVSTPLNALLFSAMGLGIMTQTAAAVAVAVALWRQPFTDAAMGWALRLGLTISIVGSATGGLMTRPTPEQLAEVQRTGRMAVAGAHAVGVADGGPGLPGTGWSTEAGDIRIAHFVGLHALQVLPFVVIAGRRRLGASALLAAVFTSAALYSALFALLLWQALRGESIAQPGVTTIALWLVWALAAAASTIVLFGRGLVSRRAAVSA
jgi:hypothetical protein